MSHLKERIEKNCLNCGVTVAGRYCQQCGQENVEVKESFLHLIMHFIEDVTHFDGKLWKTLKLLIFKPGSLTKLYMEGKRASYIHPIRMYLFVSAVFFLFIFKGEVPESPQRVSASTKASQDFASGFSKGFNVESGKDSINYKTVAAYNTAQQKLPVSKRDKWLEATVKRKGIELNEKYQGDIFKINKALIEKFEHYFSRMLYISLPFFAFFLWILYRRNKNHFFVDHLIFSIHLYYAFFIILFVVKIIDDIYEFLMHKSLIVLNISVAFILFFYLYKSLRNQFHQSRSKTFVKFFILSTLTFMLMSFLLIIFLLLSLFNI